MTSSACFKRADAPIGELSRPPRGAEHRAAVSSYTRQYAYAATGNRLLRNSAPGEAAEPFSHSYSYDEHANMTAMPHLAAMAWDHADRLQHCDLGGGGDVWFVYDAAGERVRKVQVNVSGSVVRERVYLGGVEVYRERAANSAAPTLVRESLHVGDDTGRLCLVETLTVRDGVEVASPVSVRRHQYGNHLGSASLELEPARARHHRDHSLGAGMLRFNDDLAAVAEAFASGELLAEEVHTHLAPRLEYVPEKETRRLLNALEVAVYSRSGPARQARILEILQDASGVASSYPRPNEEDPGRAP